MARNPLSARIVASKWPLCCKMLSSLLTGRGFVEASNLTKHIRTRALPFSIL